MKNLNLLFTKIYYEKMICDEKGIRLDDQAVGANNALLFEAMFDPKRDFEKALTGAETFRLQVEYPGMILGAGNLHCGGLSDDEIKMGFSFDYVTGQPYIPGSSVKGVLRSCFEQYPDVIMELTGCGEEDINPLVAEIFDGADVFHDAVLCRGGTGGRLLGEDYITPHDSPIKAPVPIRIVKLIPGVAFEFRFVLGESETSLISADAKLALFKKLLVLFGIGAKTNVGYGGLREFDGKEEYSAPTVSPSNKNNQQQGRFPQNSGYKNQNRYTNSSRRY